MRPRQTRRRSVHGRLAEYSWIGCAAVLCFALAAVAAPPPNPDPQFAPWFNELSRAWRPGSGATVKCCDIADCRVTDYREIADHYEVLIDERGFDTLTRVRCNPLADCCNQAVAVAVAPFQA